jgi:hypothetical protein
LQKERTVSVSSEACQKSIAAIRALHEEKDV